ncbi:hypothetical protein Bca4012_092089 [Brassica carinata]
MSSINSVFDLKPFKTTWKIMVKVIRLWKQYSAAGGETIEMVFCDVKIVVLKCFFERKSSCLTLFPASNVNPITIFHLIA